jgi:hypothetical protein
LISERISLMANKLIANTNEPARRS